MTGSRDSKVSIETAYGLDDRGIEVRVPVKSRMFSPRLLDRFWGPPSLLYTGYQGLFIRGIKQPRSEADHSSPTNTEVKKTGIYIYTPPYVFMA
jgi:hypothetical protein